MKIIVGSCDCDSGVQVRKYKFYSERNWMRMRYATWNELNYPQPAGKTKRNLCMHDGEGECC